MKSFGKHGTKANRLLDVIDSEIVFADLMSEQAEHLQGAGMLGFHLENMPVHCLGLMEIAGLVIFQSQLEHLRHFDS